MIEIVPALCHRLHGPAQRLGGSVPGDEVDIIARPALRAGGIDADRVDHPVGTDPAGEPLQRLDRVLGLEVDHLSPGAPRHLQTILKPVHGQHPAGPQQLRAEDREQPTGPQPSTATVSPGWISAMYPRGPGSCPVRCRPWCRGRSADRCRRSRSRSGVRSRRSYPESGGRGRHRRECRRRRGTGQLSSVSAQPDRCRAAGLCPVRRWTPTARRSDRSQNARSACLGPRSSFPLGRCR